MIAAYAKKKVLVLGDYRQTVTVVRSLGRAGFRVVLVSDRPHGSTALSRYVAATRLIGAAAPDRYRESLKECIRETGPDFVFPVGESELRRLLHDGRHPLAGLSKWVMPEPHTVLRCFDKRAMYHLAATLGIPVCGWRPYSGPEALGRDVEELGFPVVVKRKDSSAMLLGNNAVILRSPRELALFTAEVQHDPDPASLMLQKHAPGQRHNCHFAADRGRIVAYFQQKVLRTDKPDGTGIGIEGVSVAPTPQLREYCERLLGHLDYTGIGCVQFLVDERSGAVNFLELNARMDSTAVLPYRLGVDFPLIALRIADRAAPHVPESYAVGKRYYYLYGALNVWLAERHRQPLRHVLAWPLTAPWAALRSYDLILDWRDPLPALHQIAHRVVRSASKRRRRAETAPARETPVESSARS